MHSKLGELKIIWTIHQLVGIVIALALCIWSIFFLNYLKIYFIITRSIEQYLDNYFVSMTFVMVVIDKNI